MGDEERAKEELVKKTTGNTTKKHTLKEKQLGFQSS